jgi:hypothetical protein
MAQNSNPAPSAASEPAPPPGPSAAELEELENEIDQLNVRAAAVNNSLDRFQATSGYGLRGDMVAHQASMKINLAKAQDALSRSDVDRARKYEGLATADVEALEKFLGRR